MTSPTSPAPSFRTRWAELMSTRHTPRRWAIITNAIATADAATVDAFGDPLIRGGEDWCRVAFTAMEAPDAIARAADVPDRLPARCLCDVALLRAWLGAPGAYADPVVGTVADLIADRDWSQLPDETTHAGLQQLLDAAQDAGVYGADGFRIELHGLTGDDGWISDHLVVARPEVGPGLASRVLVGGLAPTRPMAEVDSAIWVLSAIAFEVDNILDHAVSQDQSTAGRDRTVGHAFRTSHVSAPAASPDPPIAADSPPMPTQVEGWPTGDPTRAFTALRLDQPGSAAGEPPTPPLARPSPHR